MSRKAGTGILIGIAGGSGSGKTLIAQNILRDLGTVAVILIQQDAYYRDLSHLPFEARCHVNFDHPDAIDIDLLCEHIQALLSGGVVDIPIYDFTQHRRLEKTRRVGPHSLIVLEGILVLYYPRLRDMMDIKVFVDTDPDIRLIRRLRRDIHERGRTLESVLEQYETTVQVMHREFVEPTKRYADIIIPEGGENAVAVDLLKTKIRSLLLRQATNRES